MRHTTLGGVPRPRPKWMAVCNEEGGCASEEVLILAPWTSAGYCATADLARTSAIGSVAATTV